MMFFHLAQMRPNRSVVLGFLRQIAELFVPNKLFLLLFFIEQHLLNEPNSG